MAQTYYELPQDVQDRLDEHPFLRSFLTGDLDPETPISPAQRIAQYLHVTGTLRAHLGTTFPTLQDVHALFATADSEDRALWPPLLDVVTSVVLEKDHDPAGAEIVRSLDRATPDQWRTLRAILDRADRHTGSFYHDDPVGESLLCDYARHMAEQMGLIVQFDRDRWRQLAYTDEGIATYSAADCVRHLSALNNIDRWWGGFLAGMFADGSAQRVLHRLLACADPTPAAGPVPLGPHVCAQLGTYVYVLVDPRDHSIFYAGKGRGNRIYAHVWAALEQTAKLGRLPTEPQDESTEVVSAKLGRIRQIYDAGYTVEHWIVRHHISPAVSDDAAAFQIEQGLIDALRILDSRREPQTPATLTNLAGGHTDTEHGAMRVEELAVLYGAEPAPLPLPKPSVVLRVNAAADSSLSDDQIYEAARGYWRASGVLEIDGLLAFVIAHDVIRAVFRVESWTKVGPKWKFTGAVDTETDSLYRGKLLRAADLGYASGWPQQGWARRT
ncbi:MAG: hypothetical protein WAX14_06420 [Rhodococcus sp. (in: high G+C Gram-positive bacteria)]|uniref:LEM-3-like GIY-YIG domain-containing protein n=1 Tax=Rhodococcus sp. TaxID=1831 RepID=UPI003BB6F0F4